MRDKSKHPDKFMGAIAAFIFAVAVVIMASFLPLKSLAQQFTLPPNTIQLGMLSVNGNPPTGSGCTVASGSTDSDGTCTATASSGTIAFAKTNLVNAPFCIVSDAAATPLAVYTVTTAQITLASITSTHIIRWHCAEQAGQ